MICNIDKISYDKDKHLKICEAKSSAIQINSTTLLSVIMAIITRNSCNLTL